MGREAINEKRKGGERDTETLRGRKKRRGGENQ